MLWSFWCLLVITAYTGQFKVLHVYVADRNQEDSSLPIICISNPTPQHPNTPHTAANLAAYMASAKVQLTPSSLAEFLAPDSQFKACVLANR
jgi:hypothetical protein